MTNNLADRQSSDYNPSSDKKTMSTTPETTRISDSSLIKLYDPRVQGEVPDGPNADPTGVPANILRLAQEGLDMVSSTDRPVPPIYKPTVTSTEVAIRSNAELQEIDVQPSPVSKLAHDGVKKIINEHPAANRKELFGILKHFGRSKKT